jgi:hypothetical protein
VCRCSCGREITPTTKELNSGNTRSCGCLRNDHSNVPDLTGKVFRDLTVLRRVENCSFGRAGWLCRCVCGREITLSTNVLHQGRDQAAFQVSCGCHKARMRAHPYQYVLSKYVSSAKKRGHVFTLSNDLFERLLASPCDYCGAPPSQKLSIGMMQRFQAHADFSSNGIDRVDNCQGYIDGNVVPCCTVCNWMKRNYSRDQFIAHIRAIAAHLEIKPNVLPIRKAA